MMCPAVSVLLCAYRRDRKSIRRWIKTFRSGCFESSACSYTQNDGGHCFGLHLLLDTLLHHYTFVRITFDDTFFNYISNAIVSGLFPTKNTSTKLTNKYKRLCLFSPVSTLLWTPSFTDTLTYATKVIGTR